MAKTTTTEETTATKPSPKQKELLKALTTGRRAVVVLSPGGRQKAHIENSKGQTVDGVKTTRILVESCLKKGWLRLLEETDAADGPASSYYEITDEGLKARKSR